MKKQNGFTLVEISTVVALGSLILLLSLATSSTLAGFKSDNEVYNLTELSSNLLNFYSVTDGFNGNLAAPMPATNVNLLPVNLIPTEMIKSGSVINAFGGNVTIAPILFGSPDPQKPAAVTITELNVPTSGCIDVINRINDKFAVIQVDSTTVKSPTVTFKPTDPVFGPVFTNACNASTTHTIVYTLAYIENQCHSDTTLRKKCTKF